MTKRKRPRGRPAKRLPILARLPRKLDGRLRRHAASRGTSVNDALVEAVKVFVEDLARRADEARRITAAERERRLRQEFETRTTGMPASGLR